jgi:hypothetical protein
VVLGTLLHNAAVSEKFYIFFGQRFAPVKDGLRGGIGTGEGHAGFGNGIRGGGIRMNLRIHSVTSRKFLLLHYIAEKREMQDRKEKQGGTFFKKFLPDK